MCWPAPQDSPVHRTSYDRCVKCRKYRILSEGLCRNCKGAADA